MHRRTYLSLLSALTSLGVAGCNRREYGYGERSHEMRMEVKGWSATNSGWELTAELRNVHGWDLPFHDVTVHVFGEDGEELQAKPVGEVPRPGGDRHERVSVETDEFPAIVTISAAESPCDDARILILYWVGSDDQRRSEGNPEGIQWDQTVRRCDEPIPPQRVVDRVGSGSE